MSSTKKSKEKGWFRYFVKKEGDDQKSNSHKKNKGPSSDYFKTARTWSDDYYTMTTVSRDRYRWAFYGMSGLTAILAFSVMALVPLQHTELVIAHEGPSGYTWLSTTESQKHQSQSWARTASEIAHYVRARESYDPVLYANQTQEVDQLSNQHVQGTYELSQSSANKNAPINLLGAKGYRTVIINNVLALDSVSKNRPNGIKSHINLAQVDYVVEDHLFGEPQTINTPYTALVSWTYNGTSSNPQLMLSNWDGFMVTKFKPQPVNTGTNPS
jgi:type IV secretory pathway component VirB8